MTCPRQCRRVVALLLLLCCVAAGAVEGTRVLIVDLYVNHERMGDAFVLLDDAGNYYIDEAALRYWQIARPWPEPLQFKGESYYGLHQFYGATAELDHQRLELRLFLPASLMPTRRMSMRDAALEPQINDIGVFMDYDLNWLRHTSVSGDSIGGLFRPVVFGPFGNVSANLSYRNGNREQDASRFSVLDLTYTRDDPGRMRSLRLGDVITDSGRFGRPLRIGGIQIGTNFATRPMFITYPLPEFYGQSAVPSALDIYVNGRLSQREEVQPGSFVLEDVPVVNGAGQLQVVATDALGRRQVFTQDFYLSTDLLKPGLSDYSFTAGALREDFGLQNFRYGDLAASGTWRRGMRDDLTVEAHGEIAEDVLMGSAGLHYGIDAGGTVSSGLAVSNGDAGSGARWQLGFQRLANPVHFNIDFSGSTDNFRLVGLNQPSPALQVLASAGRNFYERGALRASVVHQSYYDRPKRTIWGLDYSARAFGRVSVAANLSYLDSNEDDLRVGLRFFVNFGRDYSVSGIGTFGRDGSSGNVVFRRNMPMHSGYGYHVGVGRAASNFVDAGVSAQNNYGAWWLDVRSDESAGTSWQAASRGSVAYMSGVTRAARQINDAFAVVKVGDIEGVRVYSENVEVGRTNSSGHVFVPNLRPYLGNKLSIEIDDLPLGARIGDLQHTAAPFSRSGVVVEFDVRVTTNILVRAVTPDGVPLPQGAVAQVRHTGDEFPVGTNGKLYLQGIDRSSQVTIRWNGNTCDLDVPYPRGSAVISKLGDVVCEPRS
jgi:outer membrane usher protein